MLSFDEAFEYIKQFNIHTRRDWASWSKEFRPKNIPSCPNNFYKEWISWDHWLRRDSYTRKNPNTFLNFEECRDYIGKFKIRNKKEWDIWSRELRPKNIPATPNLVFRDDWISWSHWLSSDCIQNKDKIDKVFYKYDECLEIVHSLNIKNIREWQYWYKNINIDLRIPSNPDKTYKKYWKSWFDFLGSGHKVSFLDFDDALLISRNSGCKSMSEWFEYSKDIKKIPRNLPAHYKEKWINVSHWLGIEAVATNFRKYMSFKDAREYIRSLNYIGGWVDLLSSDIDLPYDIPRAPHHVYKDEWVSYSDFIGYELKGRSKGELSIIKFLEAHSINYEYQKRFSDCSYKRPLIFDFWLPDFNIIIEYDGIQHFQPVEYFGGVDALNEQKNKDNIKDNWCLSKGIKIVRISYTDDIELKLKFEII